MFLINKYNERKNKHEKVEPSRRLNNMLLISDKQGHLANRESRLNLSMRSTLESRCSLPYFMQYMEIKGYAYMVQFYLSVQRFKESLKNHDSSQCQECIQPNNNTVLEHANSNDCITRSAINIFTSYVSNDAGATSILVSEDVRRLTISKICQENGQVDIDCYKLCCEHVLDYLSLNFYLDYLESELHYQYRLNILMNSDLSLEDVLFCTAALHSFSEFMESEESSSLLKCWLDIDDFNIFSNTRSQEAAMVIYDRYFSLQAFDRLEFPDRVRLDLEGFICSEQGDCDCDCFSHCLSIVVNSLNDLYLPNYLASTIFRDFISNVEINTIQTVRKRDNDSDSELSISSRNNLMVMNAKTPPRYKGGEHLRNSRIKNSFLHGDDSKESKDMSTFTMGSINQMGKFIPSFQAPNAKKEGILDKLIGKKDEDDQQIANEVARKIVAEINASIGNLT